MVNLAEASTINDENANVCDVIYQAPIVESTTSRLNLGKRRLMWIIFSTMVVILIALGIIITTIIITKNKGNTTTEQRHSPIIITLTTKWKQYGTTAAGGYEDGDLTYHLPNPTGIYIDDDDQSIYAADWSNDRIVKWRYNSDDGEVVAGGNGYGSRMNQLGLPADVVINRSNDSLIICDKQNRRIVGWPRRNSGHGHIIIPKIVCESLTMDNNGNLYFSDGERNEVKRWGQGIMTIVAGGNGGGNDSNQLHWPTYTFVDQNYSVYISEYYNHRVTKWLQGAHEGIIVAGGYGQGNDLTQLNGPQGVIVDHLESVYVADSENDRIMRWLKGSTKGSVVAGGNGQGRQTNQLNHPQDISFDENYNLYIADDRNHRVQKFGIDSN